MCSLLAVIIQLYGSKNPTDTNVHGQSAGYSLSNTRSEVVSLIFFQKCNRIFHFSQCQSCSGKCYSFCKRKLKTIITWLTYLIIKMPGTTHLPRELEFAATTFRLSREIPIFRCYGHAHCSDQRRQKWRCLFAPLGRNAAIQVEEHTVMLVDNTIWANNFQ